MVFALRRGGWWLVATLTFVLSFVVASPARASCAEAIPIGRALAQAHAVFVGTATDLQYQGRVATFQVEDVWKGAVGATVVVNGGPALSELEAATARGEMVATSGDRSYVAGERYLVVAYGNDGSLLLDNGCSHTQPYSAELLQHRPASAYAPLEPPGPPAADEGGSPVVWFVLGGLAVGAAGIVTASMLRQRSNRTGRPGASAFGGGRP